MRTLSDFGITKYPNHDRQVSGRFFGIHHDIRFRTIVESTTTCYVEAFAFELIFDSVTVIR